MSDYLDPNNEELMKDFFLEAELQIENLEQNILVLENDPGNGDAVDEIFRAAHTLKGAAATVQMDELAEFTHLCEDVLDEIRNGKLTADEGVVNTLLAAIDTIKSILDARSKGRVFDGNISSAKNRLQACLKGNQEEGAPKPKADSPKPPPDPVSGKHRSVSEYDFLEMQEAAGSGRKIFQIEVFFNEDNLMNTVGGIQIYTILKQNCLILKTDPNFEQLYQDQFFPKVDYYVAAAISKEEIQDLLHLPEMIVSAQVFPLIASADTHPEPEPEPEQAPTQVHSSEPLEDEIDQPQEGLAKENANKKTQGEKKSSGGSVLRVDSRRIDNILNLVSETVITKASFNQIESLFGEISLGLQNAEATIKDRMRTLFSSLPGYFEKIKAERATQEVMQEISNNYGDLFTPLEPIQGRMKEAIGRFQGASQILNRTTGELQEGVMQIRMVPISRIFNRFPRLVRDVSRDLNKQVRLVIEGEETELDKSVVDDLIDPLIHCVRNSVDHGLEMPEERKRKGKSEEGTVFLRAANEGSMIVIDINDDGKGIDVNAVRHRAVSNGLIHPSKSLSDVEAFNLIFEPGFSTAKTITNISGRGVGLDVVKKQIEKLNGSVNIWSELGSGTKVTIKLPLTLAIIQGLLVRVGEEVYAIPISTVLDGHRIKSSDIDHIDNYEVFNVRNEAVSLFRLSNLFKIPVEEADEHRYVILVGSEKKKMGLMVDALIGEEDVVIKPLKDRYTNVPGIAGATILGDGTVALIIDVGQLLELGFSKERAIRDQRAQAYK